MSKLYEGVKFTSKEKSLVQSHNKLFNVGVEYEFHLNSGLQNSAFSDDSIPFENINFNTLDESDFSSSDYREGFWGLSIGQYQVFYNRNIEESRLYAAYSNMYIDSLEELTESKFNAHIADFIFQLRLAINEGSTYDRIKKLVTNMYYDSIRKLSYFEDTLPLLNIDIIRGYIGDNIYELLLSLSYGDLDEELLEHIIEEGISLDDERVEILTRLDDLMVDISGEDMIETIFNMSDVTYYERPEKLELPDSINDNLYSIVDEHAFQVEVITNYCTPDSALSQIRDMFGFISEHGYTSDSSGMHVSISTQEPEKVDLLKFLVLMETGHIVSDIFPSREYVDNIDSIFNKKLKTIFNNLIIFGDIDHTSTNTDIFDFLIHRIRDSGLFYRKEQSIKFGDYDYSNGRIELRFFGGEDYEDRYDEIEFHIYRALYILLVSSSKEFDKVFKKELFSFMSNAIEKYCKEQLIGLELAKLYSRGKIKDMAQYNRFITHKSKKHNNLDMEAIHDSALVNGSTVYNLLDKSKHKIDDDEWDDLNQLVNDMKKGS